MCSSLKEEVIAFGYMTRHWWRASLYSNKIVQYVRTGISTEMTDPELSITSGLKNASWRILKLIVL